MAITVPTDAYCEVADVERLTGKDYSAVSAPTTGGLETIITEIGSQLNGVLDALGFSIPIAATATKSLAILSNLNATGAAAQAEFAVPGLQEPSLRAESWRMSFDRGVRLLVSRGMSLPDATTPSAVPVAEEVASPSGAFSVDSDGDARTRDWTRSTLL